MPNRLKNRLNDLLHKGSINKIFPLLNAYLENDQLPTGLKGRALTLENRYDTLKQRLKQGVIDQATYDIELQAIVTKLQALIDYIPASILLKTDESEQEKPKSTSRPPTPTSTFDQIFDKIKQFPSSIWGSKKSSKSPPSRKSNTDAPNPFERVDNIEEELPDFAPPAPVPAPPASSAPKKPKKAPINRNPPTQTGGAVSPFQQGKILYAIPDQMHLAHSSRCKVRIAHDQFSIAELSAGLTDKEKNTSKNEALKITQVMKVELVEAGELDNFDITARNSAEQPILPFGYTEWSFDVQAKRPGHYALLLRVSAKINIPSFGERAFDVAVLDRAIIVQTNETPIKEVDFAEQTFPDLYWDEDDEAAVVHALEQGRIDLAFERIANFVQDKDNDFHNQIILLQARWNDNTNQLTNKLISASDWDVVNNKIRYAITQLLPQLKESFPPNKEGTDMDWAKEKERLVAVS